LVLRYTHFDLDFSAVKHCEQVGELRPATLHCLTVTNTLCWRRDCQLSPYKDSRDSRPRFSVIG
jgi:hypothetical protein